MYLPLSFLVTPTHPYRTLSYPILLLPAIPYLYLPHPVLSLAPMAILYLYTILHPILSYLIEIGPNDPGTKRLRAETTHQIRQNLSAHKIRPNDPDRPRAETPGPYAMAWSYISFKYEKLWQMKKYICIH